MLVPAVVDILRNASFTSNAMMKLWRKRSEEGRRRVSALYNHRHPLTATDAQRCQAVVGITPLHFVEQGHQYARAAGSNGVAQGDGTAIDVELRALEAELFTHRDRLCGKSLVGLNQVQVRHREVGLLQRTPGGGHGAHAHYARIDARRGIAANCRQWLQTQLFRLPSGSSPPLPRLHR